MSANRNNLEARCSHLFAGYSESSKIAVNILRLASRVCMLRAFDSLAWKPAERN